MSENNYGFEYFCGANVLIKIGNVPILEASGISFSINESKFPLYGYSSRHYDAVAHGRVLVNGNIAINFVHQDYLMRIIEYVYNVRRADVSGEITVEQAVSAFEMLTSSQDLVSNEEISRYASVLEDAFWGASQTESRFTGAYNPHDNASGIDLQIIFGEQNLTLRPNGVTGILIEDVHFTGRSNIIQISEDAIVEVYPFFARNLHSLRSDYLAQRITTQTTIFPATNNDTVVLDKVPRYEPYEPETQIKPNVRGN